MRGNNAFDGSLVFANKAILGVNWIRRGFIVKCPECQSLLVRCYNVQTFPGEHDEEKWNIKYRWRICSDCQHKFSTVEMLAKVRVKNGKPVKIDLDTEYQLSGSGDDAETLGAVHALPGL